MAQGGDTVTYTFSGSKTTEDISDIDEIQINHMNGAGGGNSVNTTGGAGGRIENATVDVSSYTTLEIWVGGGGADYSSFDEGGFGRSIGGENVQSFDEYSGSGAGSTELWTNSNSNFIAAADGGGGGGRYVEGSFGSDNPAGGGGGARGGTGGEPNGISGAGAGDGGDGGEGSSTVVENGNPGGGEFGIATGGNIVVGGGDGANTDGEIKLTFKSTPLAPSNLSATLQ